MMLQRVAILPTGNEIANGVVLDTDSPMIMQEILRVFSRCEVRRFPPILDEGGAIADAVREMAETGADCIIVIGGSGEGHRHSPVLGKDCTHTALEQLLENPSATALYGKNGHMWSRLVCGRLDGALVLNVPGPYREAEAAVHALLGVVSQEAAPTETAINTAMAEAVRAQYG